MPLNLPSDPASTPVRCDVCYADHSESTAAGGALVFIGRTDLRLVDADGAEHSVLRDAAPIWALCPFCFGRLESGAATSADLLSEAWTRQLGPELAEGADVAVREHGPAAPPVLARCPEGVPFARFVRGYWTATAAAALEAAAKGKPPRVVIGSRPPRF